MNSYPFCGSAEVGPVYNQHPDGHEITMICCSRYGAAGPVMTYSNQWDDDEAESAWNKRQTINGLGIYCIWHRLRQEYTHKIFSSSARYIFLVHPIMAEQKSQPDSVRLLDQVREKIRLKHYSIRTEQTYVDWIKRFILHFDKRHPRDWGGHGVTSPLGRL